MSDTTLSPTGGASADGERKRLLADPDRPKNYLNPLGEKIFLDRYAWKDGSKESLAVGDTVIVCVDEDTRQREIATVVSLDRDAGSAEVQLRDDSRQRVAIEHIDKPLEVTPDETMARIAKGIAAVETDEAKQQEWEARFRYLLEDWKFVPGGRIWAGAGTDQNLTYYNCMPPEQEILTEHGYKPIGEVEVGERVVTHRNRLRRVLHRFERETEEPLYTIRAKKLGYDALRLTGEHPVLAIRKGWVNSHRSRDGLRLAEEPQWIRAAELRKGDFVAVAYDGTRRETPVLYVSDYLATYDQVEEEIVAGAYTLADAGDYRPLIRKDRSGQLLTGGTKVSLPDRLEVDADLAYLFGRWLGDGCVTHRTGTDIPSGIKIVFNLEERAQAEEIATIIERHFGVPTSLKLSSTERWYDLWANSMLLGEFFKALLGCYSYGKKLPEPLMHLSDELTLELLRGLFTADGYISDNTVGMLLSNRVLATQVHQLLLRVGYFFSIFENTHANGRHHAYRLTAAANECATLFDYFFGQAAPESERDQRYYLEHDGLRWVRIGSIEVESYTGTVIDLEVDEDHSFVSAGLVVSNCYVVPSPRDSRGGIVETLSQMMEIMSRGGGVGINVSSLRPRYSYVKGVNGRSSGAVSWGGLYSFVTGLIEQGGCFGPDERIVTDRGLIPARELADRLEAGEQIQAQTHLGLRPLTAFFRNGEKALYEVTTGRGFRTRLSADHKIAVLREGEIVTIPLRELVEGEEILLMLGEGIETPYVPLDAPDYERSIMSTTLNEDVRFPTELNEDLAYLLGYMQGDGYVHYGRKVTWEAPKAIKLATADAYPEIRERLVESCRALFGLDPIVEPGDGACANVVLYSRLLVEWLAQNGIDKARSESIRVPEAIFRSPSSVIGAFIAGYFDADGSDRGRKGGYGFDSVSREMLEDVQQLLMALGIVSHITSQERETEGWQTLHRLIVTGAEFKARFSALVPAEKDRGREGLRNHFNNYPTNAYRALEIPGRYYQGLTDITKERISYRALSRIGERLIADGHAEMVAQVEALMRVMPDTIEAITPVGLSDVYDFEVDEVHLLCGNGIYSSNSRRGALMLICNDWHPDVLEFIHSKREMGKITNANISVGISDAFMEAVRADAEWELLFPDTSVEGYDEIWDGDLEKWRAAGLPVNRYKTVRAREMWQQIIESAWASAEPGLWFSERANRMSNSHYFSPLICTNPCVTGDTLIYTSEGLVPARELYERGGQVEVTIDGRFGTEKATTRASHVFLTGRKPVFRLTTREGYSLRATADHRIMTERGWVKLEDLTPGDQIHILNRKGGFGTEGDEALGRTLAGMLREDDARHAAATPGVPPTRLARRVPTQLLRGTEAMQRGFLQTLVETDGLLIGSDGAYSVRIDATAGVELEEIQRLLINFGIASRRDADALHIEGGHLARFAEEIGLLLPDKQDALEAYLSRLTRGPYREKFQATVERIEADGIEEVFDLTEPLTHSFIANGICVHNCGEQPLPAFGICNLGAVNLSRFVKDGEVQWESLGTTVRHAVRFLDNVIDSTPYFFEENATQQLAERRVGLGVMGLAEMLIRLGLRYGSPEGNAFIDDLFRFFTTQAYLASCDIAEEKGTFPAFETEPFLQSGFMQGMPEEVRERVRESGIRNVTLLTVAPTGTTGTAVGTSTGIEPYYFWSYFRKSRLGMHEEVVDVVNEWREQHPDEELPDYFVTAMDLAPEEHVRVQAAVQRWVDSSISKTCNVPNDYTVEQTAELYELMYELGCKGGTVYRDGSRDEQVLNLKDEESEEAPDADDVLVVPELSPNYTKYGDHKRARPRQLRGATYGINTPVGKAYVTVNRNGGDQPFEVFANVGKVGSEGAAMSEAIGRLISLALRLPSNISASERLEMVIEQLEGIGGSRSIGFGAARITSLPDALAKVLREDLEAHRQDDASILLGETQPEPKQLELMQTLKADLCPDCGHASFVRIEGCKKCVSCGHSEC